MLETDYLIIGGGATAMAFVDTLLTETEQDQILIVDRNHQPGGHWNQAYPFVRLHQPSSFYGVSSTELSKGIKDQVGFNAGFFELASGAAVKAYFDDVMRHRFLPSGRVQYFPMCNYEGDGKFKSLLTGKEEHVKVNKKIVDTTYLQTRIPATHTPNFTVAKEVPFIPINELVHIQEPPEGFVVIGGGKTGMDACVWLLDNQVPAERITWIVPRDSWLLDRKTTQPSQEFFESTVGNMAAQFESVVQAASIPDLFNRLEENGVLTRIDQNVRPSMFHGATVCETELEMLRSIEKVVRMGRVQSIAADQIILDQGSIPTTPHHLHIDCTASAISNLEITPVFQDGRIIPQTVRSYQPLFSASLIAYIEAKFDSEQEKNALCQVVPLPNHDTDWIKMLTIFMMNQYSWNQHKSIRKWLLGNRLDGFSQLLAKADRHDPVKQAIIKRMRDNIMPAMMKLQQFMQELA
ncbi:MAG: hypothetical protein KTR30_26335 [Saprospiraceae bacterium]|nr:hypothetical protein [Saprospiraceae bacterium]